MEVEVTSVAVEDRILGIRKPVRDLRLHLLLQVIDKNGVQVIIEVPRPRKPFAIGGPICLNGGLGIFVSASINQLSRSGAGVVNPKLMLVVGDGNSRTVWRPNGAIPKCFAVTQRINRLGSVS
jgi:hypothetical protein